MSASLPEQYWRRAHGPVPHVAGRSHRPRASAMTDASAHCAEQNQTWSDGTDVSPAVPHQMQTRALAAMPRCYLPGRSAPATFSPSWSLRRHSGHSPGEVTHDRTSSPSARTPMTTVAAYSASDMRGASRVGVEVAHGRPPARREGAASRNSRRVQSTRSPASVAQARQRAGWCHGRAHAPS